MAESQEPNATQSPTPGDDTARTAATDTDTHRTHVAKDQATAASTASAAPRHPVEGWLGLLLALVGGVLASMTLYPSYVGYLLAGSWFEVPSFGWLGWLAFAPVLVAVGAARRGRHAFARGFLFAAIFFLLTCAFIIQVHWVGWLVAGLTFGVMVGVFALLVRLLAHTGAAAAVVLWPSVWVAGDWLIGNVGIKFPWLYAAYSQLDVNPWVVQTADVFGVWGTSWLLLAVNALLAVALLTRWQLMPRTHHRKDAEQAPDAPTAGERLAWRRVAHRLRMPALALLALLVAAHVYGAVRLTTLHEERGPVVALVQNNVPIGLHRAKPDGEMIVERLLELIAAVETIDEPGTHRLPAEALREWRDHYEYVRDEMVVTRTLPRQEAAPPVDLVVFPENFPLRQRIHELTEIHGRGFSRHDRMFQRIVDALDRLDAYLLLNSIELTDDPRPFVEEMGEQPYPHYSDWRERFGTANTSTLIAPGGEVRQRYVKLELVPVGEYVPLREFTDLTRELTETIIDREAPNHLAGEEPVIFELPRRAHGEQEKEAHFASPICFESNFPELLRRFVRDGAESLIVQSDDGWFVPSNEPEQVWLGARFRAIENRVSVARAVSSGHTGVVGPDGEFRARLIGEYDGEARTWGFPGVMITEIPHGPGRSLYQQLGDLFAYAAMAAVLLALLGLGWRQRRSRRHVATHAQHSHD